MTDGIVRLSFPARAEFLILGRLALVGVSRAAAISEETLADLKLALTEACGNAVRHAYSGEQDGRAGVVRVAIEVRDGTIAITVEDEGIGLPADARANGAGEDGESGMGLAIIEAIADELDVRSAGEGGGTLLTLRKRL